jgi:aspartyl/asparaginyl beta-hydroxylase (cupin superfamily)
MNVEPLLTELRARFPRNELARVEECLSYVSGAARPTYTHPLHEPTRLFFPGLRAAPWHDAASLPWIAEIERAAPEIRRELDALVADPQAGFFPYEDPYTLELGWKGWNTYSLYRKGKRHPRNSARCPETMRALACTPHGPRQAMFTKLSPGAHITPHTGGVNVVLTCHLGLIIPEGCSIRVGDETRGWTPGRCMVFDDSFIHEAKNEGTETRIVLLWDIWHPDLTSVEVAALQYLFPIFDRMLLAGAGVG